MNSALARPRRLSFTGRPTSLAACGVLAVMLNAGAIGLVTDASSHFNGVDASNSDNPRYSAMTLVFAPSEPRLPTVARGAGPSPSTAPTTPRRAPPNLPTARTTPEATEVNPLPQQILFYTFREVDNPAAPESDWNLDVESLDNIGVQRLVFEILVSDRGRVVGCTVLEPSNLADDIKRSLEKRLSETSMRPAVRVGQLVASVRRIELFVPMAPLESQVIFPSSRQ